MSPTMIRQYYPLSYLLRKFRRYLIWFTTDLDGDQDGVWVDGDRKVTTFGSLGELESFAQDHRIAHLDPNDPIIHDLDRVADFCKIHTVDGVDCPSILQAWNLFNDVARSCGEAGTPFREEERLLDQLYDKVFWGCNLPAVTPEGERFEPRWSPDEVRTLRGLMKTGLDLIESGTIDSTG